MTNASGGASTNGGLVFPASAQSYAYDLDGNVTRDGIWSYRWDGQNRLVEMSMTNVSGVPNHQRLKLEFVYDYLGRRVQKTVSTWNGSAFANPVTNRFVYDGWNLVAVLGAQSALVQSFVWGPDLSGTLEGAGGIGGLLLVTDHTVPDSYFVAYDGNGNVVGLVEVFGAISAHYEYGPFGEPLRVTGTAAKANPFRWSTKYTDSESGLVYYGYRFYNPTLGRWLGRDPKQEEGGLNLYAFCKNNPLNSADTLGEWTFGIGMQGIMEAVGAAGLDIGIYVGRNSSTGKFSFGVLFGPSFGSGGPVSFSVGGFAQWTDANSVNDLKGFGFQAGASIGEGLAGGADFVAGIDRSGISYAGGQLGLAASLSLLVELHSLITITIGWDTDKGWE